VTKREHLQNEIIKKAWDDPSFKQALLSNPKETLKKEFNLEIPDNITLTVVEEANDHFYLTIPVSPTECGGVEFNSTVW